MRHARAAAACLSALLVCGAGSARADVAVIARGPEDSAVKAQLARLIDEPVTERAQAEPRALGEIMREAAAWPEQYVVVLDRQAQSVHVLRPSDRTMASRLIEEAEVLRSAHYAVALAAAELLEWLGVTARPALEAPQAGARSRPAHRPVEPLEAERGPGVAFGAGLELSASPGFDPELSRLALEAGVELGRGRAPLWAWLSLRGSLLGAASRTPLDADATSAERVEYESTSLSLHGALGFGQRTAALTLGPVAGLALVHVAALDRRGDELGVYDVVSPFVGLALGLRYPVAWGFSLALSAEGQSLLKPNRYRVEGERVLEEGTLHVLTRLGLFWESGPL
jgi:hypothetical protein